MVVSLNSRLESDKEEEEETDASMSGLGQVGGAGTGAAHAAPRYCALPEGAFLSRTKY